MGLNRHGLELVAPHLRGADVLCLSYPDLVLPPEAVADLLKIAPREFTSYGKAHKLDYRLVETLHAFTLAGATDVQFIDILPSRGVEHVVDLNTYQPWDRTWDLVIDPGTLEHCFNVGTAFDNAWRAVRDGGHIVHVHPLQMINHGFWNICPTALVDFYAANGGELVEQWAVNRHGDAVPSWSSRRFECEGEAVLYTKVKKTAAVPLAWPSQTRYRPKEAQ